MISYKDIVVLKNISLNELEKEICIKTANNTLNTWQGRGIEEKISDTIIGKVAEKGVKLFLSEKSDHGKNPYVMFYDDFRQDDFKSHNSVDLIFGRNQDSLKKAADCIAKHSLNGGNSYELSDELRTRLSKAQIRIAEIKSTRISQFYKTNGRINFSKMLAMDFLTYPKFLRKSSNIDKCEDYISVMSKKHRLTKDEIIEKEKNNVIDWYIRVFVDEKSDGTFDVYILGVLYGKNFFEQDDSFIIKKMPKIGKSENALYLSKKIKFGMSPNIFRESYVKHNLNAV